MKPQISRCVLFCVLVLAIFGAMFTRLGSMQIQQQEDYVARAESRSTKTIIETGKRGTIYDANLHSCGDVMSLMDDILVTGVDALNPLEVKAGMDSLLLKQKYGDRLVLQGGINAVLWDQKDAIIAEIERLVPALKQGGGYIFSSDHSIPNSVSAENFRAILDTVKRVGRY